MAESSPAWRIKIERQARGTMRRLPKPLLARLTAAIDNLALNPRPTDSLKLSGHALLWRIRIGDWRIVYAIYDDQLIIVVVEVEPRGNAYRNL
jgi:mRNA interferase RelE/StbE